MTTSRDALDELRRARARRSTGRRRRADRRVPGRRSAPPQHVARWTSEVRSARRSRVRHGDGGVARHSPAFADKAMDVQMLQTAASIENLAVATYDTALTLDFIGGASANAVVKAFVQKTKEQHQQHAEAFNAAATRLGGKAQDQPDPGAARRGEQRQAVAHRTGARSSSSPSSSRTAPRRRTSPTPVRTPTRTPARSPPASWVSRRSTSRSSCAVKALVAGGAADLIALPPDAAKLPAAAGSVGFPNAFYPTTDARPANEGAVQ